MIKNCSFFFVLIYSLPACCQPVDKINFSLIHYVDTLSFICGKATFYAGNNIQVRKINGSTNEYFVFYIKTKSRIYQLHFDAIKGRNKYDLCLKDGRKKWSYTATIKSNEIGISYRDLCFAKHTKRYRLLDENYFRD